MAKINKFIPGAIKIRTTKNGNKYIYVRFAGDKKFTATGLLYSRENILISEKALKQAYLVDNEKKNLMQRDSDLNAALISNHFQEFIKFKKFRGIATKTIEKYKYAFNILVTDDFNINDRISLNGKNMMKLEFVVYHNLSVIQSKYKPSSINTMLTALQTFINYAYEEEIIEKPIRIKKKYQIPEPVNEVRIYSETEINKIFWSILTSRFQNKDILAYWFLFLYYTGSRRTESCNLLWEFVNFKERTLKFPNKKNKQLFDYFPISAKLLKLLKILKIIANKRISKQDFIFPFSGTYLAERLRTIQKQCGIYQEGRAIHSIRKTFATNLYNLRDQSKLDGEMIIELTRHKDKKLTDTIYRKYQTNHIIKMLDKVGI